VTTCDTGVTATKRPRCLVLVVMSLLCITQDDAVPLSVGPKMKSGWTPRRWDGSMMDGSRCVVGSSGWCWQTDSTSAQPGFFLWVTKPGATFCCGASMPGAMSMASTGPFDLTVSSPVGFPPGSQGSCPSQVDRMALCDGSCDGQLGLRSSSFVQCCGVVLCSRSPSGGTSRGRA